MAPDASVGAGGRIVSVGTVVGITGIGVYVGLGRSANAHKFSCVGAGVGPNTLRREAFAGEAAKKKMNNPTLTNNRISHTITKRRTCPSEE
jgi:hypothetical protein